ncbi:MAG: DinB family protein [Acidobacteria bacterium]|nr:MAG: DinB family protein [Acidobacteriota bacterium]REK04199.1 MAG: DinB family protein [Acidobacteriota bacterium]REK15361.1 MAG: DinB family protein [Acidobacteriota bacterium]REK46451.1 MAG: DinB family protein [Acidobacteriota bacterium]
MTETSQKLIERACEVTNDVREAFGHLSGEQLNWKPDPDSWSIAQCIDHLVTTNGEYFTKIEEAVGDDLRPNLWSRIPFWSGLVGYMIKRAVNPESTRKVKTFGVFQPAKSDVPDTIVEDFAESQEKLLSLIRQTDHLNRKKITLFSPVSDKAPLKLSTAFEVLVIHERRHFNQAVRVAEAPKFPGSTDFQI